MQREGREQSRGASGSSASRGGHGGGAPRLRSGEPRASRGRLLVAASRWRKAPAVAGLLGSGPENLRPESWRLLTAASRAEKTGE